MDSMVHKFQPAETGGPTIVGPTALGVKFNIEHDGQACVVSLTLVRTHYQTEGASLAELIVADGTHYTEHGSWAIKRSDEGPATLLVDSNLPFPLMGTTEAKPIADRLMAELVRTGGSWGIESVEACS